MTSGEATGKVHKLLALAAPGSGATPDEAATAAQLAHQICAKYGISPSPPSRATSAAGRALPGQVIPGWTAPRPQRGYRWEQPTHPFGSYNIGVSGVTDAQARVMAIMILSSGAYLSATEQEIIEGALNGLLTEYGKILLDGLYALAT